MLSLLLACAREPELTAEELRDPATCEECHPTHVAEWRGSMHAHAGEDPVFLAMNARGQRETDGELGDFCLRCHAPLAVELGEVADGSLDGVPEDLKGVTCAFCHQVDAVEGEHNNPLRLAQDLVLRGGVRDPLENRAHASAWSPLHDRDEAGAASMCGSCHDIVTPLGGHIERTYLEWQGSLFSRPPFGLTCGACHMPGRDGLVARVEGAPKRRVHDHSMPGVDVALVPFPDRERQRLLVQEFLDDSLGASLCVYPTGDGSTLVVGTLENVAAGHGFPSGATADRRVWVEAHAYEGGAETWATGVAPGGRIGNVTDPNLWGMWSTLLDEGGSPTHDFWEAADIDLGDLLPVQVTLDPSDPDYVNSHVPREWVIPGAPDRVTFAVHVQPIGLEILDDLVASGDLDPAVVEAMPTFTLAPTVLEWTTGAESCVR